MRRSPHKLYGKLDIEVNKIVRIIYEDLKKAGFHEQSGIPLFEEYRVFVYAGRVLAIDDYWKEDANLQLAEEEFTWEGSAWLLIQKE